MPRLHLVGQISILLSQVVMISPRRSAAVPFRLYQNANARSPPTVAVLPLPDRTRYPFVVAGKPQQFMLKSN